MRVLCDPGAPLSEVARITLNITRAAFHAMVPLDEGWCGVVWLCAACVS